MCFPSAAWSVNTVNTPEVRAAQWDGRVSGWRQWETLLAMQVGGIRGNSRHCVSFSSIFSPAVCFCENLLCCVLIVHQIRGGTKKITKSTAQFEGFCSVSSAFQKWEGCFLVHDAAATCRSADWLPFTSQQVTLNRKCVQWRECLCIQYFYSSSTTVHPEKTAAWSHSTIHKFKRISNIKKLLALSKTD